MELKEPQGGEPSRRVLHTQGYWFHTSLGPQLDLNMGNSAYVWGYQDPDLISALTTNQQVSFVRGRQGESCELLDRVNDRMRGVTGMDLITWTVSGSDAVEAALEMSYQWHRATDGRVKVVSFAPGYHGCTWLAKALRGDRTWSDYVTVCPAPAWATQDQQKALEQQTWSHLIACLDADDKIGTVLIESLPWMTGVREWSTAWWQQLRKLCDQRGLLLCIDDVAGGFGKVAAAASHTVLGIEPDIVVFGKAITGGHVPLSCAMAHSRMTPVLAGIDWFHGHTWQPFVPGLAVIERILDRVDQDHFDQLVNRFDAWICQLQQDGLITGHRGLGLMKEILLTRTLKPGDMEQAGLVLNGVPYQSLVIIVPQIADDTYWQELDQRVRNLLQ
jgi:adenosylmethionine-8-amino-7-oxononanoate aminotransferase